MRAVAWTILIVIGAKPWEFRGRSFLDYPAHPQPGDRIAIHAAVRPVRFLEVADLFGNLGTRADTSGLIVDRAKAFLELLFLALENKDRAAVAALAPLGAAVIGQPVNARDLFGSRPGTGDEAFNWAWPMGDVEKFPAPVPARGLQGFWEWTP